MDDEREELRQQCLADSRQCQADLDALRGEQLPERAYRLIEKMLQRLDSVEKRLNRIETGSFAPTESPTEPERRPSQSRWRNDEVLRALEEGRKPKDDAEGS